jgi:hypothetical protein
MIRSSVSRRIGWAAGVAVLASVGFVSVPSFAQETVPEATTQNAIPEVKKDEWPCVYRKVPVLSAATIWDGPEIKDTTSWHSDEAIRKLSQYAISRRVKMEDVEAAIKKFAAGLPADKRDAKLTELFSAVLSRTNEDRKTVMHGIEKMHKQQVVRSEEIKKEALALQPEEQAEAENPEGEAGVAGKGSDAQEKYKWEIRAFQEKQANIPLACEIPQLIDERAGDIARAIRAEMKS